MDYMIIHTMAIIHNCHCGKSINSWLIVEVWTKILKTLSMYVIVVFMFIYVCSYDAGIPTYFCHP